MFELTNRTRIPALALKMVAALLLGVAATTTGRAAPKPVPPSPYLGVAYRYADAMLKNGRDSRGPRKTGLLLSALDRTTLTALADRPIAPAGVPDSLRAGEPEGPLVGANPQHDQNLLRVLYTLSELSSKPVYREAADSELKWFLEKASPADAPLAAWDNGATWNVMTDALIHGDKESARERTRPWMLWDRCFEIAPEASKRLVMGLVQTPSRGAASPRKAGSSIRAFAVAYRHTGDDALLKAIEAALDALEAAQTKQRGPVAQAGAQGSASGEKDASAAAWLSAAIDCDGAAARVPAPLATRLKAFAARADQNFCSLPHDLPGKGGFVMAQRQSTDKQLAPPTPLWQVGQDGRTTAQVAMMCVSRYENTGSVNYRKLLQAAADAYRDKLPPADVDAWPMTFGHAISLQLAAWRATSRQEYLDRARKVADAAVQTFWGDDPLPRASTKSKHYESVTGSDTLTLSLIELHLSILGITAVRTPPNTIDR